MSKINLIDLPIIQNQIIKKHREFLDRYSMEVDKVVADNRALTDLTFAKMHRLLVSFKEAGIVDELRVLPNKHPLQGVRIMKNALNNYIEVITNGRCIMSQGFGYTSDDFQSDSIFPRIRVDDVCNQEYDWSDFAMQLLDYIHVVIYQRKDACETKMNNVLEEPELKNPRVLSKIPGYKRVNRS